MVTVEPLSLAKVASAELAALVEGDIFARLVPLSVIESLSVYAEETAKLVRVQTDAAAAFDKNYENFIKSTDIYNVLRDVEKSSGNYGPSQATLSELDRLQASEQSDGLGSLLEILGGLRDQAGTLLENVAEVMADDETESREARSRFGAQWTQAPTEAEFRLIRSEMEQRKEAFVKAREHDARVLSHPRDVQEDVAMVLAPREQLLARYPTGSLVDNPYDVSVVGRIRELMSEISAACTQRDELLAAFRKNVAADDISQLLVLNPNNERAVFDEELQKYAPTVSQLTEVINAAIARFSELDELFKVVGRMKQADSNMGIREALDSKINKAVAVYLQDVATARCAFFVPCSVF